MVTLGLTILQVGDHWLWGRVINGKSLGRFGQHGNVSKLVIKDRASNVTSISSHPLEHSDLSKKFLGHNEPFFL